MDIYNLLDWIQEFQSSTTDLSRCNPPMTDLEKQKCVEWVIANIINEEYLHRLDEINRGLDYWSIDKNVTQIEVLTFRILDDYLSWYLRLPTIDILHTYIESQIEILEEYIHQYDENITFSKWDLYISINDILWSLIYTLWNICESFGIDINKIQLRTSCRLPLAEFIGLPHYTTNTIPIKPQPQTPLPLESYIIKDKQRVLKAIDTYIAVCNKPQGKRIALIICALEQYGYISNIDGNIERIIKAFRQRYPNKVSSRQSVSQYLNAHRNPNAKTDKPPFMDEELEMFIKTI